MWGWTWEGWAVLGFTALVVGNAGAWSRCPSWMTAATLAFVVGLWPDLDALARHSVTLHGVQSVLIHHIAPWCVWQAQALKPLHRLPGIGHWRPDHRTAWLAWLSFAAMSGLWIWPELHLALMTDAALYSGMKWGMALTGLWLCHMQTAPPATSAVRLGGNGLGMAMAAPQIAAGLYLLCSPLLYLMPECFDAGPGWQGELLQWVSRWHPLHDQRWGGALLVVSSVIFYVWDVRRRHSASLPVSPHCLSERVL